MVLVYGFSEARSFKFLLDSMLSKRMLGHTNMEESIVRKNGEINPWKLVTVWWFHWSVDPPFDGPLIHPCHTHTLVVLFQPHDAGCDTITHFFLRMLVSVDYAYNLYLVYFSTFLSIRSHTQRKHSIIHLHRYYHLHICTTDTLMGGATTRNMSLPDNNSVSKNIQFYSLCRKPQVSLDSFCHNHATQLAPFGVPTGSTICHNSFTIELFLHLAHRSSFHQTPSFSLGLLNRTPSARSIGHPRPFNRTSSIHSSRGPHPFWCSSQCPHTPSPILLFRLIPSHALARMPSLVLSFRPMLSHALALTPSNNLTHLVLQANTLTRPRPIAFQWPHPFSRSDKRPCPFSHLGRCPRTPTPERLRTTCNSIFLCFLWLRA